MKDEGGSAILELRKSGATRFALISRFLQGLCTPTRLLRISLDSDKVAEVSGACETRRKKRSQRGSRQTRKGFAFTDKYLHNPLSATTLSFSLHASKRRPPWRTRTLLNNAIAILITFSKSVPRSFNSSQSENLSLPFPTLATPPGILLSTAHYSLSLCEYLLCYGPPGLLLLKP